jgi:hypothetical protein
MSRFGIDGGGPILAASSPGAAVSAVTAAAGTSSYGRFLGNTGN